jgi:hypothetical protein
LHLWRSQRIAKWMVVWIARHHTSFTLCMNTSLIERNCRFCTWYYFKYQSAAHLFENVLIIYIYIYIE